MVDLVLRAVIQLREKLARQLSKHDEPRIALVDVLALSALSSRSTG
jgi:hypothetical protein